MRVYATVSALLTALICWPLFGGHLLYRDAVATPRFPLTPGALGIDGAAPRAVPQDAALAVASRVVDGGPLVAGLTAFFLFAAGVGYGRLAARLVPQAGRAGATAAAVVGIWNPYVAERLLQGHWSLLAGYAALGWLVCAVLDTATDLPPETRRGRYPPGAPPAGGLSGYLVLAGLLAAAGLTPTGSLLALIVVLLTALSTRAGPRRIALLTGIWLVTASPWLVGALVATGAAESSGAAQFALRGEPWLGTLGTALGLGGIWNAEAVPTSRASFWAALATAAFLLVIALGAHWLYRRRTDLPRAIAGLAVLAGVTVAAVALAATPPGLAVMAFLLEHLPGAGLLRDTQKYLALAVPFAALAAAAAVAELRRRVPAGFAVAAVAALIVAPLADLAWGVGGKIAPVSYPGDYDAVTALIADDPAGARDGVVIWPPDQLRDYPWAHGPSLTPLPRMLGAPVIVSGELVIDGVGVDSPSGRTARILDALNDGDAAALARLGIGWVVVEEVPTAPELGDGARLAYRGDHLLVYRIAGADAAPAPGTAARVAAGAAHVAWAACLIAGAGAALWLGWSRRSPRRTAH